MITEFEQLCELEMSNQQLLEENYSLQVSNSELEQQLEDANQEVQDLQFKLQEQKEQIQEEQVFHASIIRPNHGCFHLSTCEFQPAHNNLVVFSSRQEAIQAGYTTCKTCNSYP